MAVDFRQDSPNPMGEPPGMAWRWRVVGGSSDAGGFEASECVTAQLSVEESCAVFVHNDFLLMEELGNRCCLTVCVLKLEVIRMIANI